MQKPEVVPTSTRLDLCDKNGELFQHVAKWLRKHGKLVKPKLSNAQKEELNVVFKLMDEDGSGAIDVEEMQNAFNLLGYHFNKHEIRQLISEVAEEGKEEVNYDEFLEVMTVSLIQMTNDRARTHQFPVSLISTAYTRKKLLEQILEGTAEGFAQVLQAGEEQQKAKEKERLAAEERAKQSEVDCALPSDAIIRVSQVSHLSLGLLSGALSPREIQALASMSSKLQLPSQSALQAESMPSPRQHRPEERPPGRLHMSLPHREVPWLQLRSEETSSSRSLLHATTSEDIRSLRTASMLGAETSRSKHRSLRPLGSPRVWEPEDVVVGICASLPALPPLVGGSLSPQDSYLSPRRKGDTSRAGLMFPGSPRAAINLLPALTETFRR